jgi:hypothetical protein
MIDSGSKDVVFVLEQTGGGWRISATRMIEAWTDQDKEQRTAMLSTAADLMARLSQEVADGKYPSPKEFFTEVQQLFGR